MIISTSCALSSDISISRLHAFSQNKKSIQGSNPCAKHVIDLLKVLALSSIRWFGWHPKVARGPTRLISPINTLIKLRKLIQPPIPQHRTDAGDTRIVLSHIVPADKLPTRSFVYAYHIILDPVLTLELSTLNVELLTTSQLCESIQLNEPHEPYEPNEPSFHGRDTRYQWSHLEIP